MTRLPLVVFTFLMLLSINIFAQEAKMTHKDSLNSIIEKYYALNLAIFQSGSKVVVIDDLFKLFTDDFVYIHPKYGGTYSRKELYDGYTRNQKNGGYNGSVTDIKVIQKITGLNAVVVNKRFVNKKDGKIKDGDEEMTLFEFRNGKIFKIFEYW